MTATPITAAHTALRALRPQIQDLELDNIAELAARAGVVEDPILLWYGEGDMVTPAFIRDAASKAMADGLTFYVPTQRGWPPLIEALSDYQTHLHGRPIGAARSTVAPSGMQALLMALMMICEPGRNVVYLDPQWPNTRQAIHVVGAEPRPVALAFDGARFALDIDRLLDACDARTRAIIIGSPSNPCGWTASRAELRTLLDATRRRGIWLIGDEVYNRLWYPDDPAPEGLSGPAAPSLLQIAEEEDLVMTVNTFSKAWAMTGWRIGWLTHPASLARHTSAMVQYMNSGTAAFTQAGALAALRNGEPLVADIRVKCREGLDVAYEALSGVERVLLPEKPLGGMYAFFRLAGEADSKEACALILERARVGLTPGYMFGDAGRAFLRMCVFRDAAQIGEAGERIAAALKGGR